jgi:malyl-CoA/(S)-citramalyl-CoA lyase
VRQDPADGQDVTAPRAVFQQDLWHYTVARMVDACVQAGIYPYYGPFGDIADVVACEDQFRNAYLLGCVGAWTLHPVQIEIAGGSSRRPSRTCSGPAGWSTRWARTAAGR